MSMDSFVCDQCGNVDSIHATRVLSGYICHRCSTGEWHNNFPEEKWEPSIHGPVMNRVNESEGEDGYPSFS